MKVGIIGGSGLDDSKLLENYEEKQIETKYGFPSAKIICGKLAGVDVCILARHGRKHEIPPSQVNYRANIAALKLLGCTHIIATSAVGSLKEEMKPGDIIFPNQFIDFTKSRKNTFYDEIGEVQHLSCAEPFSSQLRSILIESIRELGIRYHEKATVLVFEGPRFSTRAESFFYREFADVLSMTLAPEIILAKEAGIEYATIAMSTDYDCWKQDEAPVTWEIVKQRMNENAEKVKKLIMLSLEKLKNS